MRELLSILLNISTLVFAVTSMLSVGFSYTLRQIIDPLRNLRGVLLALLANFVLVAIPFFVFMGAVGSVRSTRRWRSGSCWSLRQPARRS